MGMLDKYGNEMGSAAQDVYWRSVLPGYEGQSSSFAIPGYNNEFAGAMRPNFPGDSGQELRGPDNWAGAIQGDRHLMSNMTKGLNEEEAYRVAQMIDSGELDHLNYGSGRRKAYSLLGQGWTYGQKKEAEEEAEARGVGPSGGGGGGGATAIPRTPTVRTNEPTPWSPFPGLLE